MMLIFSYRYIATSCEYFQKWKYLLAAADTWY